MLLFVSFAWEREGRGGRTEGEVEEEGGGVVCDLERGEHEAEAYGVCVPVGCEGGLGRTQAGKEGRRRTDQTMFILHFIIEWSPWFIVGSDKLRLSVYFVWENENGSHASSGFRTGTVRGWGYGAVWTGVI